VNGRHRDGSGWQFTECTRPWSAKNDRRMTGERSWQREAVVYQIYPQSFNDTDGDGIGDVPGIVEKLDYLDDLGVDTVWLNPVYESPWADNGYDISDYRSIHEEYGTMDDWETLRDGLHDRDIRLIMDLVVNHTSDEHEWFQQSRYGVEPYDDYYVWRRGDPDERPNSWDSLIGGKAWSYDEQRGAWYLHLFDSKQPDLNWRNPRVREDVYEMMTWWLEQGIDGFRMDVINLLSKVEGLPDGDPDASLTGSEHFVSGPRIHEYVRELVDETVGNYDVFTVGETLNVTVEEASAFVEDGLDMVFPFDHMYIDEGEAGPWDIAEWDLADLKAVTTKWQEGLAETGWNSLYLNNHDEPRMVSRFGDDETYRCESAKLLATFAHTLQGTPYVYQGEEIGMTNVPFESLDEFRDVATVQRVELAVQSGQIDDVEEILADVNYWSRDNARTPMQWSDEPEAGFTDGEPWIKVNPNYTDINVECAREDEDSVLNYYRELISLREEYPVLVYGAYELILGDHPEIYAYHRTLDDERLLVVLNFFDGEPRFEHPGEITAEEWSLLLGNYAVDDADPSAFACRPYEARVYHRQT
jgi:oligo-1,6-glucosidase